MLNATVNRTFGFQIRIQDQILPGLHQMLYEIFAVHVVLLPVLDGLLERVAEEPDGAVRIMVDAKYAQQGRLHEYDGHPDLGPQRRLEHGLAVLPELRALVVDGVQLEPESAGTDHVRRIRGHHLPGLDLVLGRDDVHIDLGQQCVRALLHLLVHVFQLVSRERGAELLPHRSPPFAPRKEYIVVERVGFDAGVQAAVREIVKVFNQYVT